MKKRNHFHLVLGTVFPFDTLFTTAPYDGVIKWISQNKKYPLNDYEKENLHMDGNGRTVMLRGGQVIIRLPLAKTKLGIDIADLAHEIEHASSFLFKKIGVIHSDDSDEVFAYYQGYLMKKAMLFFDEQMGRK